MTVTKRTIWRGRSSPLLYIYLYLAILALAFVVQRLIGGNMYLVAMSGIIYLIMKARSMQYVLSEEDIYFSPSLGDDECMTVLLSEILAIQVIHRQPWKFFGLGTLIFITNPDEDMQPCMKCIASPHALARTIRRNAQAIGAPNFPIETV
jgi:hypothetical protein